MMAKQSYLLNRTICTKKMKQKTDMIHFSTPTSIILSNTNQVCCLKSSKVHIYQKKVNNVKKS